MSLGDPEITVYYDGGYESYKIDIELGGITLQIDTLNTCLNSHANLEDFLEKVELNIECRIETGRYDTNYIRFCTSEEGGYFEYEYNDGSLILTIPRRKFEPALRELLEYLKV